MEKLHSNPSGPTGGKLVDVVKWIATVIQLIGYGLTGLHVAPRKDRAIMVVHLGAFISLFVGYLNA